MLTRSSKSVRSIRSLDSSEIAASNITQKTSLDQLPTHAFEGLLPFICKKFNCDFDLHVKKDFVRDIQRHNQLQTPVSKKIEIQTPSAAADVDHNCITVRALYDSDDSLVEIILTDQLRIPRLLLKSLAVIAPIYENVNKITIRKCRMDCYTVYELNKLTFCMNLTDVCLDDCFLREANYAILLEKKSTLRQLSLCRCYITDVVCQQICSKLRFSAPAEKSLLLLNLSGNRITVEGAKYVGEMLRTNRSLRYLNLADNLICDDGVRYILDALMLFPLTYDEIAEKRRITLHYFRRKRELTRKFMNDQCGLRTAGNSTADLKVITSNELPMRIIKNRLKKNSQTLKENTKMVENKEQGNEKAEILATRLIGELQGPFCKNNIVAKDGWTHCVGNLTLSYLNLSYNNLTYFSVKKVLNVLMYQSLDANGLFRIILEGNCTPEACPEYEVISELLNKKISSQIKVRKSSGRRISCSRSVVSTASSTSKKI